jgi:3-oxoadipate enol-lactonase
VRGPVSHPTAMTVATDDGIELMASVDGPDGAPALLCLNSLGTGRELWDAQVPAWSATRRVLRFDQRGHGTSSAPAPPYTIERLGRDAVEVLDAFGVQRAALCGLSLGGVVGLWVAVHHPERVERLVLACTAARVGTEQAWRDRADAALADGTEQLADLVLSRFFSDAFRSRDPRAVARCRSVLAETSDQGYAGACLALAEADLRQHVADVRSPTLLIAGAADVATPPEQMREQFADLPDARWVELEDAGHLANLEAPAAFTRAVQRFLDGE